MDRRPSARCAGASEPSELKHEPVGDDLWAGVAFEGCKRLVNRRKRALAAPRVPRRSQTGEFGLEIGIRQPARVRTAGENPEIAQQRRQRSQAYGKLIALGPRCATAHELFDRLQAAA